MKSYGTGWLAIELLGGGEAGCCCEQGGCQLHLVPICATEHGLVVWEILLTK